MPPNTIQKRKLPSLDLQRRVRARKDEPEPEPEIYSEDDDLDNTSDGEGQLSDDSISASHSDDEDDEDNDDDEDAEDFSVDATQLSFGALAKAQSSMPHIRQKKKKGHQTTSNEDGNEGTEDHKASKSDATKPSKPPKPQRSSKHAPTEMSSKRQVTRKREVVSMQKVAARDPRFSAAGGPVDEERARQAYAFLDEYRDSEMAELRAQIKKTRQPAEKERLTRELKSAQSRKEARVRRDAERDLIARHRRQEKELVAQGKKPFYLKKSEQKKQLLIDRFAGMKKKQVDRTIERRRKKLTSRERREMPVARRSTG